MIKSRRLFIKGLCALSLLFASTTTFALEEFVKVGIMQNKSLNSFTIEGQNYRISPNVEIVIDRNSASLSQLKDGDNIWVRGTIFSDSHYVERIVYERYDNE